MATSQKFSVLRFVVNTDTNKIESYSQTFGTDSRKNAQERLQSLRETVEGKSYTKLLKTSKNTLVTTTATPPKVFYFMVWQGDFLKLLSDRNRREKLEREVISHFTENIPEKICTIR